MKENQLGENIIKFRKAKGLSQEKVAEVLGVSRQAVTKWESNISRPSSDNLIKLADTLGVSVEVLLGSDEYEDANESESVEPGKTPWIFIGISAVCFISYMIISNLLDALGPIMESGAKNCVEAEIKDAKLNREQRRALGV